MYFFFLLFYVFFFIQSLNLFVIVIDVRKMVITTFIFGEEYNRLSEWKVSKFLTLYLVRFNCYDNQKKMDKKKYLERRKMSFK